MTIRERPIDYSFCMAYCLAMGYILLSSFHLLRLLQLLLHFQHHTHFRFHLPFYFFPLLYIVFSLLELVSFASFSQSSIIPSLVRTMAPTTATYTARVTRSATRKNSTTLVSLDAGVRKRFQCIICDKKHRSRAALSHHFKKSHPTRPQELSPFTHPSCWGESSTLYPISRQHLLDMMGDDDEFDRLSAKKQRAIEAKITYAQAGVRNKKQLRQKEDQQRLCLLHWWFRTNEEALRARMEFGPEGLFPRQGNINTPKRQRSCS